MPAFRDETGRSLLGTTGGTGALERLMREHPLPLDLFPVGMEFESHPSNRSSPRDLVQAPATGGIDDLTRAFQNLLAMTPAELDRLHLGVEVPQDR